MRAGAEFPELRLITALLLASACGTAQPSPQPGTDSATVDSSTADSSADADAVVNPEDGLTAKDGADAAVDATVVQVTCPTCPPEQKCRPDTGACVTAGVAECDPPCVGGLVCRLTPPPACQLQTCKLPTAWAADVLKLTSLSLDDSGVTCSGGKGNALSKLAQSVPLIKQLLSDAVANDQVTVLTEPNGLSAGGGKGSLRWLFGTRAETHLKCDPTSQKAFCAYTVSQACWDRTTPGSGPCAPWMSLPVQWSAAAEPGKTGALSSGKAPVQPPGDVLQFGVPLAGGAQVLLQVHQPRLDATVVTASAGQPAGPLGWRQAQGSLCGAVPLADIDAALAGLPPSMLASFGGLKAARALRAQVLPGDVDLDGDGKNDAASAALQFTATRAMISGLSPLDANGNP
ncbi:MAG: hypothetical protein FJ100_22640 [Deltaproteobacteria bacterium]|nr:hypothetical protein [Deltaproteobacteria bacterium]